MTADDQRSLGDEPTFSGDPRRSRRSGDRSLGDERTLDAGIVGEHTLVDGIEVVDLAARYVIEGALGQGGMGTVLLATDTRLGRKVAIKRILGEAAANRGAVARFLTEAKAIAALNHPNIVQIYEFGRATDGPFLIMEYAAGGSLRDRCSRGPIPVEETVSIVCQVCDGLARAHDQGIIHRDIKPANVLLTQEGRPKLTDFGLAKDVHASLHVTATNAVMGTPDFMPPEQQEDASLVDHRSDLWSLAATVYQMVTGRTPKIIRLDGVPSMLQAVLAKALEEKQDARYQTVREFRDALKASLRVTATVTTATESGQCPACGTANEASRKFCRACGGSLVVPCLSCGQQMPLREEICGGCGARQTPLVETRRAEMAAARAQAEKLLGDCEFAQAAAAAVPLRDETHPRLAFLRQWAQDFLAEVERTREAQRRQAAESLAEALTHEKAHDYLSAVFTLEMVSSALHAQLLPGARETIAAALDRVRAKQSESRQLDRLVRERVAARKPEGLLPHVVRLLELQPERADLTKLREHLERQHAKLASVRDAAVASAERHLARHDYDAAHAELARIHESADTDHTRRLRQRAAEAVAALQRLAESIRSKAAAKDWDGLVPVVDEYLRIKPDDTEAVRIRDVATARRNKDIQAAQARIGRVRALMRACDFQAALESIGPAAEEAEPEELAELRLRCGSLAALRGTAMHALEAARRGGDVAAALAAADRYRGQLVVAGLADESLEGECERCRRIAGGELLQRRAAAALVFGGIVLAAIVGVVAVGTSGGGDARNAAPADAERREADRASAASPAAGSSRAAGWGEVFRPSGNSIGMEFVRVPAGEAYIVTVKAVVRTDRGEQRKSGRRVPIVRSFLMGRTEVTQSQWREVMKSEPWKGRGGDGGDLPVTFVTRDDAIAFCVALTNRETADGRSGLLGGSPLGRSCTPADIGTVPGVYSLPTADQWDYACLGTRQSGVEAAQLDRYGWTLENSGGAVHEVGLKKPNRLGLHDMHGNVQELCFGDSRGGGWSTPATASTAERMGGYGNHAGPGSDVGFRVIVELP